MPSTSVPETLDYRPSIRQTMVITRKSLETDGHISRVEIDLEGGQGGPPAHIHPGQREIYTVDAGELVVTIDGAMPDTWSTRLPVGAPQNASLVRLINLEGRSSARAS
jgi:hypothetical protein